VGQPLLVTHEAGILTVTYEDLKLDGLLNWLKPQKHEATITITVQKDCPTQLGVATASAIVSGVSARTTLKGVSGDVTLDRVAGAVDVNTVSGNLEGKSVDGEVRFHSVSGDLTLADGCLERLNAKTVSGRVTADVQLAPAGEMRIGTLSGEVALRLPADTGAQVDLRATSGMVRSDFDLSQFTEAPGVVKTMTGTIGAGSGRLSITSVSGDVTILQRSASPGGTPDAGPEEPAGMSASGQTKEGEAR
jgi:DUF4097 and DUF4098 domain-containing protein YvlB